MFRNLLITLLADDAPMRQANECLSRRGRHNTQVDDGLEADVAIQANRGHQLLKQRPYVPVRLIDVRVGRQHSHG